MVIGLLYRRFKVGWICASDKNRQRNKVLAGGILPGAPTTEPPDATNVYTAVTPSATTLTTATLDSSNLNESKAYYSRVKYADDSSTGSLVESEFSPYHEIVTAETFGPPEIGADDLAVDISLVKSKAPELPPAVVWMIRVPFTTSLLLQRTLTV